MLSFLLRLFYCKKMRVPAKIFNRRHRSTVVKRDAYPNNLISKKHNGLKQLVMGEKNLQFANPIGGVRSSAVIYNSIEAVKESGLYPYRYLL